MTWLFVDAVVIMVVCAALGALVAWLVAVAFVPTRADLGLSARSLRSTRRDDASRRDQRVRRRR